MHWPASGQVLPRLGGDVFHINKVRVDAFDQDIRKQFKSTAPVYNQVENDSFIQKSDSGGAKIFWIVLVSMIFIFVGLFFIFINQKHKEAQAVESARLAEVQRVFAEMEKAKETARIAAEQEELREVERNSTESTDKDRYQILSQGSEVKDTKTGLVWQRCSVGQTWNGRTCSGEAETFNFDQAQALAARGWRVPSKDELASLIVVVGSPTIDAEAFPATPSSLFWTSTPDTDGFESAWDVNFYNGFVNYCDHSCNARVRLVR